MAAKTYRARCLVLSKTKLGETDAILTMLAEEGDQVRAVAKGLRKPGNRIGARLEPFSVVDLMLHRGRSLDVVSDVKTVCTNAQVREDLVKASAAAVISEFLVKLTRDGATAGDKVFPLSLTALAAIGESDAQLAGFFSAACLLKAMAMQGFRPALRSCALCGSPVKDACHFDISAGGTLCDECWGEAGGTGANAALVSWLDLMLRSTFAQLQEVGEAPTRPLLDFADTWIGEHLGLRLKSTAFLKSLY